MKEDDKTGLTVLSLFDGMSCGQIALERAGIKINKYYASEIELSAIKVTQHNYKDTIQLGDVTGVRYEDGVLFSGDEKFDAGKIDIVMGGSPCTNFSSIGDGKGMDASGEKITSLRQYLMMKEKGVPFSGESYLFWEYLRILSEVNPRYFLLENVVMAKRWQKIINDNMGVEPVAINSSLVSAQNRPRLYWTNIQDVMPPKDKGIKLDDILMKTADKSDVSNCLTVKRTYPRLIAKYGYIPQKFNSYNASEITDKACSLSKGSMVTSSCATLIFVEDENGVHEVENLIFDDEHFTMMPDGRYNLRKLSIPEMERLQTVPEGYTDVEGVSMNKRSAMLGNGWTVDVIAHILSHIGRG